MRYAELPVAAASPENMGPFARERPMMLRFLRRLAAAAGLGVASLAVLAQAPSVPGEPARAAKEAATPKLRIAAEPRARQLRLAPVSEDEVEAVRARNRRAATAPVQLKRLAVGVGRGVEGADTAAEHALEWVAAEGGRAARLSVTSPDAAALRVAVDLAGVATGVELVFAGSGQPDRLFGPYRVGDIADRSQPWWSPMVPGETLTVEFFAPEGDIGAHPRIAHVGHLFANPLESTDAKRGQDIGTAGACNVDLACSPLNASAAFRNLANSVAQMVFNDAGILYLCTGTLLNDTDTSTQRPWFYSANHCFDSDSAPFKTAAQLQVIANTLTTLWFFDATGCNSATANPGWQQVGGGAALIYNNVQSDALLLRLNNEPPSGAFFAGWDANPVAVGSAQVGVHHPQGDLKKVSQGSVLRFARWDETSAANQYIEVRWSSGTTEGGSSGSGLFTASGSQYLLRGGLRGGTALCTNLQGVDYYSRFDQVYPSISQYLASGTPGAIPFANVTALWWVSSESGWGLNLIHRSGSNIVFGTWYTYGADGKRTWIVMPSGSWTTPTTYTGTLYTTTGPPFDGPYDPAVHSITAAGTGTLAFTDANNATWTYTVNGVSGSKAIRRFEF